VKTTTIARAGLSLGLGASLAANVAHAVAHSSAHGQDGTPVVAIAAAMFWPVALLATSELLFRLRFDRFADVLAGAAVAAVALGAGWISFGHTRSLLLTLGESKRGAMLGALAVDGVLVASGLVLYREASAPECTLSASAHSGALDDERTPSALASAPERTLSASAHSDALDDERTPSALASAPECTPSAPRVRLVSALAESASAPRVHASAPDECTPSAPRVHSRDADLHERLRVHLREHPGRASARAVASALGVGQARAARLLAQVRP
jgi:hypothetical protein